MATMNARKRSLETSPLDITGMQMAVAIIKAHQRPVQAVRPEGLTSFWAEYSQGPADARLSRPMIAARPDSSSLESAFVSTSFLVGTLLLGHCVSIAKAEPDESTRSIEVPIDLSSLSFTSPNRLEQIVEAGKAVDVVDAPPEFSWSNDRYNARLAARNFGASIHADS